MFGTTGNILTPALGKQLVALQKTARNIDATQNQLATGNRVTSALDNPQNFFQSLSLTKQSGDLSRLLDGIGQSIRTVQATEKALEAIQNIVDQAEFVAREAKADLLNRQENISDVIIEDDPIVYFKLNEENGVAIVGNSGTEPAILGQYFGPIKDSGTLHFSKDSGSISFDGVDDYINIPNNISINTDIAGYPERTVELTFQANDVTSRQVLYKAGGISNAMTIYIEDGSVRFVARDSGDFGPFSISAEIKEGETYHVAFVLDSSDASFKGYVNGEVVGTGLVTKDMNRHGGSISIGRSSNGAFFQDGPDPATGYYFNGKMSDFAIYNDVLSKEDLQARYTATQLELANDYQQQVADILSQVDAVVEDASYRGVNLLGNDNLLTYFSRDGSSQLEIQGDDFSYSGLGFSEPEFKTFSLLDKTISDFEKADDKFRQFSNSLASDLNIIKSRQDYTVQTIGTLKAGSNDLVVADQNEVGANLLALSTSQAIQVQTLALSNTGTAVADLLAASSLL